MIINRNKLLLTIGFIVSLMILICLIGVCLVIIVGCTVGTKLAGPAIIGSFILSAVVLGLYVNKVINKIKALW